MKGMNNFFEDFSRFTFLLSIHRILSHFMQYSLLVSSSFSLENLGACCAANDANRNYFGDVRG